MKAAGIEDTNEDLWNYMCEDVRKQGLEAHQVQVELPYDSNILSLVAVAKRILNAKEVCCIFKISKR